MGTLDSLTGNVGGIFSSLGDVISKADIVLDLVHALGWQSPPGVSDLGLSSIDLSNLVDKLDAVIYASPADTADTAGMLVKYGELLAAVAETIVSIDTAVNNFETLLSSDYLNKTNILSQFVPRLLEYTLGSYISTNYQLLYAVLRILGIIESTHYAQDDSIYQSDHVRLEVRFDRIPMFFSSQIKTLPQDVYGWGTTSVNYTKLLGNFNLLFQALGSQNLYGFLNPTDEAALLGRPLTPAELNQPIPQVYLPLIKGVGWDFTELGVLIYGIRQSSASATDAGIGIMPMIQGQVDQVFSLSNTQPWTMELDTQFELKNGILIKIQPNTAPVFDTSLFNNKNTVGNDSSITLTLTYGNATNPVTLLSVSDDLQLTCQSLSVSGGVAYDGSFETSIGFGIKSGVLAVGGGQGDGFLTKILPDGGFKLDFDITAGWTSKRGIYFSGSGGLQIKLPLHIDIGPVQLQALTVSLLPNGNAFPIAAGADIQATLGPLVAVVQNIGMSATFTFPSDHKGNLGFADVSLGFKPPNGVGLQVDTGLIVGGGFLYLNPDQGEYYGALELEFQDLFSLKAVGIINTKMPDGSSGFSLLILITADFVPIQLGFGFTLNGVGGLLGLNRTMDVDVLKAGVKTGAIQSILFPQDIVNNINKIISDIKQIFPVYEGHFIVGPMGELGWAEIITLEIGILVEIPDPKVAILGVISAIIPDPDTPLLKIQINFVGIIDIPDQYISFDADLYDSYILIYPLTGQMAFRLSWGSDAYFILSVGGFNPAYKDAPPDLQNMTRLGMVLLNNDVATITVTCYFAVTSNTVQFGAKVVLYAGCGAFNVYGYLGFDVLFQFDPFYFEVDIYAGLSLRSGSSVIMGITLSGELSGPTPWDIKGSASFTILFFTISVGFHETWGQSGQTVNQPKVDILSLLVAAIADNGNWKAVIPDNNSQHVSLRAVSQAGNEMVIHPFGSLTFSERVVPLNVTIVKFGNGIPQDANNFNIVDSDAGDLTVPTMEQFAPNNFFNLTNDQKLSQPSFESMASGFSITGSSSLQTADVVSEDVVYRLTYLRKATNTLELAGAYNYAKSYFQSNLKSSAVSKSSLSFATNRVSVNAPDTVSVNAAKYAIAGTADMKLTAGTTVAGSYTEANDAYQKLLVAQPALKGQVQIVFDYELSSN